MSNFLKKFIRKSKSIWQVLDGERDFKTPDENYFCQRYITRIETNLQDISLPIGTCYNFFSAALIPAVGEINPTTKFLIAMHLIVGLLTIIPLVKSPIQRIARAYLSPGLLLVAPLSYLWAISQFMQVNDVNGTLLMTALALVVSIFAILLSPAKSIFYLPLTILITVFACYMTTGHKFALVLNIIFGLANFATVSFRRMQHVRQLEMARQEYAILIQAAPAKIVRHSAETKKSIAELFAPQELPCVCLSSDWRGYQSLSAKKSTIELSTVLGEYYQSCGDILSKWLPEGNYYADWIADEFFVVAYAKDDQNNRELANQMIQMSQDLLLAKQLFYQKHGFPRAIDIGISSGPALIGMMGPDWHKKATALGEVPGQSRRYQTAGKLLRIEQGETDRIIFGPETLLLIDRPFEISEFKISDHKKIRDVETPSIYYIDTMKVSSDDDLTPTPSVHLKTA